MAGDHLKKVQSGDALRIPARTFNTILDATRDYLDRQQSQSTDAARGFRHTGIVLVRNDSGADRDRFHVLGIDGPVFTPTANLDEFKNRVVLKGKKPSRDDHLGKFVVLLEPIKSTQKAYCPILADKYKMPSGAKVKVEVHPPSGLWNVTASGKCPEKIPEDDPPSGPS